MDTEFFKTLVTIMFGALVGGIVNHLFTRRKNKAEIEKLELEANILRNQLTRKTSEVKIDEVLIYGGRQGIHGYDIDDSESISYNVRQGMIVFEDIEGGVVLQSYMQDGDTLEYIPKNERSSGKRKFHISCEMKVISASYDASFTIENLVGEVVYASQTVNVSHEEWTESHMFFHIRSDVDFHLYIYVQRLSEEGSLQIRNLLVAERVK